MEDYSHSVGTCYRCHSDVEPISSEQWFVKMQPLAKEAIRVVEDGEVKFVPDRFSKTYLNWMYNVRDWCISRQLWWGHRIPAWYCKDCGHVTVSKEDATECEVCHSKNIEQDPDVLDTCSPPRSGPSPRSAGPKRPRTSSTSTPPTCSSRATTSSSSGSPA